MKTVVVHNFRSIKDRKFNLHDYSIFVGANSSGKTNLLAALRIFHEDKIKFDNLAMLRSIWRECQKTKDS